MTLINCTTKALKKEVFVISKLRPDMHRLITVFLKHL